MRLIPARRDGQRRTDGERRAFTAAAIAVGLLIAVTYMAFNKQLPFSSPFELKADFAAVNQLRLGSEVRIGGIRIGGITDIEPGPHHTSVVTMEIDDQSVPIHTDAVLAIKPRLVLEGNDYVDLSPGTLGSPVVPDGGMIPLSQTSHEVQLDQVLDVLTQPTRQALVSSLGSLATGLSGRPSGASGLDRAARELDSSLRSLTQVADAAQGSQPGDLARATAYSASTFSQLANDPGALADLVSNTDHLAHALAVQQGALAASITGFDQLTRAAPPELTTIDGALPTLTTFANALRPGLRIAPAPLREFDGLLTQLAGAARPDELTGLVASLHPVLSSLPPLQLELHQLFSYMAPVGGCAAHNIIPALDLTVPDPGTPSGRPAWQDLIHEFANLAGAASDFDGNGTTIRLGVTFGEQSLAGLIPGIGQVFGLGPKVEGIDPTWLGYGVNPAYRPDAQCAQQALPVLGARASGAVSAMRYSTVPAPSPGQARILALLTTPQGRRTLLGQLLATLRPRPAKRPTSVPTTAAPIKTPAVGLPNVPLPSPTSTTAATNPLAGVVKKITSALPPVLGTTGPIGRVLSALGSTLASLGGHR